MTYTHCRGIDSLLAAVQLHELADRHNWYEYCQLLMQVHSQLSEEAWHVFLDGLLPEDLESLQALHAVMSELDLDPFLLVEQM
jgi:hypothetical protein